MEINHVSDEFKLRFEGDLSVTFYAPALTPPFNDFENLVERKITGVQLSYAYCGEQDFGINPMKDAFGAGSDEIIKKVPAGLTVDTFEDVSILKYGSTYIPSEMFELVKKVGMAGYWDYNTLIICASKKFEPILLNIIDFIEPNKVQFAFHLTFAGPNLMIITV